LLLPKKLKLLLAVPEEHEDQDKMVTSSLPQPAYSKTSQDLAKVQRELKNSGKDWLSVQCYLSIGDW
jgi:hypothetical protein